MSLDTGLDLPVIQSPSSFRPTIYWYLSFRCNLACKHCSPQSSPFINTAEDLTPEETLAVIKTFREVNATKVILSGGEPLLRPDAKAIIQAIIDEGISVGIETNGMLINKEMASFLRGVIDQGGDLSIAISLDGGTAEAHDYLRGRGSFTRVLMGLTNLRAVGLGAQLQCVMNKKNLHTVRDLYKVAFEHQVGRLQFAFLHPVGRALEYLDEINLSWEEIDQVQREIVSALDTYPVQTIVKLPPAAVLPELYPRIIKPRGSGELLQGLAVSCSFPLLSVLPNGDITVCALTRDEKDAKFGNVRVNTLKEMWYQHRFDLMREQYVAADWLKGICGDCVFKYGCKGSCRAIAKTEFGDYDEPHPMCQAMADAARFPTVYKLSYRARLEEMASAARAKRAVAST
jgi:radical SAM protein with 4Fe4S-binding SPASM domain